jgi:single-strand DNA-binding protein
MSNNINVVVLGGHLTRDVDLRFSDQGVAFATVGLAVNNRVKRGEEWFDDPCFVDVKLSGKRAEAFAKYHQRGSAALFPRASLKFESWTDKQSGDRRTKLVVKAQDWEFVGENRNAPASAPTGSDDTPF